jgi:hypothetical protein
LDATCNRVQNETRTTNNPELKLDPNNPWTPPALGCKDQLGSKFFSFVRKVYPRRQLIVGEERGLAFAFAQFLIPGSLESVEIPGHGAYPMPAPYQSPVMLDSAELFKTRSGKILRVEALQTNVPYATPNPFSSAPAGPVLLPSAARADGTPCDRACLEGFVNQ